MRPVVVGLLLGLAVVLAPRPRLGGPVRRGRPRAVSDGSALPTAASAAASTGGAADDDLLAVLDLVAAQVRAGAEPSAAWAAAVEVAGSRLPSSEPLPALESVADAAAHRRGRTEDGTVGVAARSAAAAWRLAQTTGAPLGDLLDAVCASVRADRADRAAAEAAMAGPRATVRILLALPVAGIALGQVVGAQPLHVLLATSLGRGCAVLAAALLLAGHAWMRALVRQVERAGRPAVTMGSA